MSKFQQISRLPEEGIPVAASPALASFTLQDKSYLGRIAFLNDDGSYDETGQGTKAVFLYEPLPSASPGTKCSVVEFYKGTVPGPYVETAGTIISTFIPKVGYTIHGINYEDKDVVKRG